MNDKLKPYYSLIDIYKTDSDDVIYYDDKDPIEEIFFKDMLPINTCLIVRYLKPIIVHICKKFWFRRKSPKRSK